MSATEQRRVPGAGKVYLPDRNRLLPQSADAEMGLLSSLLLAPKEVSAMMVSRGISKSFFHIPAHGTIAATIFELIRDNKPVDFISVTQILRDKSELDGVGGAAFVSSLWTFLPTAANAKYYAEIVIEKHALREIIKTCTEYIGRSYDDQDDASGIIEGVIADVTKIAHIGRKAHEPTIAETAMQVINDRQRRSESESEIVGMSTFLPELNLATGGLRRPMLRIIAAPENTGKTILCLNDVERVLIDHNRPVLVFSMEMSREELFLRLTASMAWVTMDGIENNRLTDEEEERWKNAAMKLATSKLTIKEGDFTNKQVASVARAWKANNPDGALIVLENLQLLSHSESDKRTEASQISEDARVFKQLSSELNVCFDVASQMYGENTKGSKGPQEHANMVLVLSDDHIFVKKSRSGGKGLKIPITIDGDHQRIIPREEEEEKPRKRGKKSVDI